MKKYLVIAIIFALSLTLAVSVFADNAPRVIDNADLLTDEEEEKLSTLFDEVGARQNYDVVVYTVETLEEEFGTWDASYYAQRLFESDGYGADREGTVLLISMAERDWGIYSTDMDDATVESIGETVVPYLSDGDYYGAFVKFAESVETSVIEGAKFPLDGMIVMSVIFGFIVAFIVVTVMKGKLKSVRSCDNAREYVRNGSFELKHSRDLYLYSTVTRIAKPKNTSGSGGRSGGGGFGGGGGRASGKF
jgi:uncharacterized protein